MLRITLVLLIVGEAVAQRKSGLSCPLVQTRKTFNVYQYNEIWYELAKYADKTDITTKCVMATHFALKDGSIKIKNTETPLGGGETYSTVYTVTPTSDPSYGRFTKTLAGPPYDVLAMDSKNYALVWSCSNTVGGSIRTAWLYTREKNPSDQAVGMAYAAAKANGLLKSDFVPTNKQGCPKSY